MQIKRTTGGQPPVKKAVAGPRMRNATSPSPSPMPQGNMRSAYAPSPSPMPQPGIQVGGPYPIDQFPQPQGPMGGMPMLPFPGGPMANPSLQPSMGPSSWAPSQTPMLDASGIGGPYIESTQYPEMGSNPMDNLISILSGGGNGMGSVNGGGYMAPGAGGGMPQGPSSVNGGGFQAPGNGFTGRALDKSMIPGMREWIDRQGRQRNAMGVLHANGPNPGTLGVIGYGGGRGPRFEPPIGRMPPGWRPPFMPPTNAGPDQAIPDAGMNQVPPSGPPMDRRYQPMPRMFRPF